MQQKSYAERVYLDFVQKVQYRQVHWTTSAIGGEFAAYPLDRASSHRKPRLVPLRLTTLGQGGTRLNVVTAVSKVEERFGLKVIDQIGFQA